MASASAAFLAAAGPAFSCRTYLTCGNARTSSPVRSSEPSSMTITSNGSQSWASTLSSVGPMNSSAL